jgi:polysaccharide chain length determinant protein (PEP-CTERM system associated)
MLNENMESQGGVPIETYWSLLRWRRWWILLSVFLCSGAAFAIGWLLPAEYRSEAVILIEEQKVPEQLVEPNVRSNVQDRLLSLKQQVLSRTRLQGIIDRFHLYSKERNWFGAKDPVAEMRQDIGEIELVTTPGPSWRQANLRAFKIHYTANTPLLAEQVNNDLTSLFIDENLRSQQQLSQGTTDFLSAELAEARSKLQGQEAKVREFKARYLGELPNQLQSNVQILQGLQAQLQHAEEAKDRSEQKKLYLESLRDQYQAVVTSLETGSEAQSPAVLDKRLKELQDQLTRLDSQYTDHYPDVVALREEIAKTQKLKADIKAQIAAKQKSGEKMDAITDATELAQKQPLMQILSQIRSNEREIEDYKKGAQNLHVQIAEYQSRLNLTPVREQELEDISRGYEEAQKNYDSLLAKLSKSALATNLQERQQGEQFRLIDPPSLPRIPDFPNRFLLSLGGIAGGVVLAVALIAWSELSDPRVRCEAELERVVPVAVLAGIPTLMTLEEERRRKVNRWLEGAAATLLVLIIVTGNVFTFLISFPNKG